MILMPSFGLRLQEGSVSWGKGINTPPHKPTCTPHTHTHTGRKRMQEKQQGCKVIKLKGVRQAVSCMMGEGCKVMCVTLEE